MTNNIEKLYELANAFTTYTVQGGDTYKVTRFTPEKQLELIKWLVKRSPIHISVICGDWIVEGMIRYNKKYTSFEQALSSLIIQLWNDLTDKQKEEIKEILR